jgi:hypothetical protein
VRGVTTECRTRRVNSPARLRNAGFFSEDFNINSTGNSIGALSTHYRLCWRNSPVHLDAPGVVPTREWRNLTSFQVQRINVKNFVLLDRQFAGHI